MRFLKAYGKRYPLIGEVGESLLRAIIPEWWAREALRELENKKVLLAVVNRDYEEQFSKFGDTVNIHREEPFQARRKYRGQPIVRQQLRVSGDTVVLNQHIHTSIEIEDVDQGLTQQELVAKFSPKAAEALVDGMENVITGEVYNFLGQAAGGIGLTAANTDGALLSLREFFQRQNVQSNQRVLSVGAGTDRLLLDTPRFVSASEIQDSVAVNAIRNGWMGRARGFNIYESSFAPEIAPGQTTLTGQIDNAAGYIAGETVLTVDTFATPLVNGAWCLIEGENLPRRITNAAGDPATQITISPALRVPVADNAVVTVMETGVIDNPAGIAYPTLYSDVIRVDGFTDFPRVGQGVSFGNSAVAYMVMDVDTIAGTILLNRPLDEGVANGATVALIPYGNYNLAMVPNAITFVNRPLAPAAMAPASGWASAEDLALRVTFSYDADLMVTTVTYDTLCSVKSLDIRKGGVLVS